MSDGRCAYLKEVRDRGVGRENSEGDVDAAQWFAGMVQSGFGGDVERGGGDL